MQPEEETKQQQQPATEPTEGVNPEVNTEAKPEETKKDGEESGEPAESK